jgi:hypothetical protein
VLPAEKCVDAECCKPDFVHHPPRRVIVRSFIYLTEAKSSPKRSATYPESLDGPPDPLFCLAPEWVYHASIVTFGAVSSYLPFSPLPQASPRRLFSVTLSVTLGCPHAPLLSQGFLPYGVRTFLSSPKEQANAHTPKSTNGTVPPKARRASGKFTLRSTIHELVATQMPHLTRKLNSRGLFISKFDVTPCEHNPLMKTSFLLALALGSQWAASSLHAQDSLQDTRNVLGQWVETRQITSKERSDWQVEKSILQDTQSLLTSELARLEETLATLQSSATAADEERSTLTEEKEQFSAASHVVESTIGALEVQMKEIIKTLPEPLVNKIKPLIRRLPEDPDSNTLSLGERVQNIVGILSQADKFNTTITAVSDSREITEDKVVEVRTLYWGLAMAYFVDSSGEYAGIGFPGKDGWEWPQIEGSGPSIQQLLGVYEGNEDIQFVEVPARIN